MASALGETFLALVGWGGGGEWAVGGERFDCFIVPFGFKCIVPGVFFFFSLSFLVGGGEWEGGGLILETVKLRSHI